MTADILQDEELEKFLALWPEEKATAKYKELRDRILAAGLLERQPLYYLGEIILAVVLLAMGIKALFLVQTWWQVLILAAFGWPVIYARWGFLLHDSGHKQITKSGFGNDSIGLASGFVLGAGYEWWTYTHGRHHKKPNDPAYDQDANIGVYAYTPKQAQSRNGMLRLFVRFQLWLLPFTRALVLFTFSVNGPSTVASTKCKYRLIEGIYLFAHHVLYFGLLYVALPSLWFIPLFFLVHFVVTGYYFGSIFATNHKGMPILLDSDRVPFLIKQIITARDVRVNWFGWFMTGGLCFQVIHHLFARMSRNKLEEASVILRQFCEENSIPYHSAGFFTSQNEGIKVMAQASAAIS